MSCPTQHYAQKDGPKECEFLERENDFFFFFLDFRERTKKGQYIEVVEMGDPRIWVLSLSLSYVLFSVCISVI